jgi:hypothetical protein
LATVWAFLSPVLLETFDKSIARSTLYHLKMVLKEEAKLHNALPHAANTKAAVESYIFTSRWYFFVFSP